MISKEKVTESSESLDFITSILGYCNIFCGIAGQVYVGSGYRMFARSLNENL